MVRVKGQKGFTELIWAIIFPPSSPETFKLTFMYEFYGTKFFTSCTIVHASLVSETVLVKLLANAPFF